MLIELTYPASRADFGTTRKRCKCLQEGTVVNSLSSDALLCGDVQPLIYGEKVGCENICKSLFSMTIH